MVRKYTNLTVAFLRLDSFEKVSIPYIAPPSLLKENHTCLASSGREWAGLDISSTSAPRLPILPANYGGGSVTASSTKRRAFRLHLKTEKITQKLAAGEKNFALFSLRAYPIPPRGVGGPSKLFDFKALIRFFFDFKVLWLVVSVCF